MSARRFAALIAILAAVTAVQTVSAQRSALDIVRELDEDRRPRTMRAEMTLRVYADAGSDRVTRELSLLSMTRGSDESYIEFRAPANIAGLRLLQTGDTMRVFFPSTGRVRVISGRARTGSVGGVGGDFTYEDIDAAPLRQIYTDFAIVGEDAQRWRISAVPISATSAYERVVISVDKQLMAVALVEYYAGGELAKRMETTRYTRIVGMSVGSEFTMTDLKANSRSVLLVDDLEWNVLLPARHFDPDRFHR